MFFRLTDCFIDCFGLPNIDDGISSFTTIGVIITGSRIAAFETLCRHDPSLVSEKHKAIFDSRILNLPQRDFVMSPCLVVIRASILD